MAGPEEGLDLGPRAHGRGQTDACAGRLEQLVAVLDIDLGRRETTAQRCRLGREVSGTRTPPTRACRARGSRPTGRRSGTSGPSRRRAWTGSHGIPGRARPLKKQLAIRLAVDDRAQRGTSARGRSPLEFERSRERRARRPPRLQTRRCLPPRLVENAQIVRPDTSRESNVRGTWSPVRAFLGRQ